MPGAELADPVPTFRIGREHLVDGPLRDVQADGWSRRNVRVEALAAGQALHDPEPETGPQQVREVRAALMRCDLERQAALDHRPEAVRLISLPHDDTAALESTEHTLRQQGVAEGRRRVREPTFAAQEIAGAFEIAAVRSRAHSSCMAELLALGGYRVDRARTRAGPGPRVVSDTVKTPFAPALPATPLVAKAQPHRPPTPPFWSGRCS
jgi:hypothetical protein